MLGADRDIVHAGRTIFFGLWKEEHAACTTQYWSNIYKIILVVHLFTMIIRALEYPHTSETKAFLFLLWVTMTMIV